MDYTKETDFSSINTFIGCRREFLFQYILHLRSSTPNIDLTFGSCWHYGKEVTYNQLKEAPDSLTTMTATKLSVSSFNKLWSLTAKHFNPEICFPKNPGHAADMYHAYWKRYLKEDQQKTIIGVENPFRITLGEGLPDYIGRLDLTTLDNGILEITDHKTSKYATPAIFAGFEASYQTDGYLTAGNLYFDQIPRITYNLALCQKSKIDFNRFTIMRTKSAVNRFLEDLVYYVEDLLYNLELYEEEKDITDRNYNPQSFKRAGNYACTKYFRKCAYFDLCHMRNNPLPWGKKAPQGYVHYEWDPTKHEANLKKALKETK